jgi:hypothetical protein
MFFLFLSLFGASKLNAAAAEVIGEVTRASLHQPRGTHTDQGGTMAAERHAGRMRINRS